MILISILILWLLVYRLLIQKIRFDYLVYLKIVVSISKKRNKFMFFHNSRKKNHANVIQAWFFTGLF